MLRWILKVGPLLLLLLLWEMLPIACGNNPTSTAPVTVVSPVTILASATNSPTGSATETFTITPTPTSTLTPTSSWTPVTILSTSTNTPTGSATPTFTLTLSPTWTLSPTSSWTPVTILVTATPTFTFTPTFTPTFTWTDTSTSTPTSTFTFTPSFTGTSTFTRTFTNTYTNSFTPTNTLPPYPTYTPACGSAGQFGYTGAYNEGHCPSGIYIYGGRYTLSQPGTITSLSCLTASGNGQPLRMAIYNSNFAGAPQGLVAEAVPQNAVSGWNTASLATPVAVPPGDYWIFFQGNICVEDNSSGGYGGSVAYTFGPFPATLPGGGIYGSSYNFCLYASLCPGPTVTPTGSPTYTPTNTWTRTPTATPTPTNTSVWSWSTVGTAGFTSGAVQYVSLAVAAATPYVAYWNGTLYVHNYNGSSWVTTGGAAIPNADSPCLRAEGSALYLACRNGYSPYADRVEMFNGSAWSTVGSDISTLQGNNPDLAVATATPYVAFDNVSISDYASVMKFNAAWTYVGPPAMSAGGISNPSICLDGGTPYVAYRDSTVSNDATVMKYSGGNWSAVGPVGITGGSVGTPILRAYNGTLYLAYLNSLSYLYVAQYNGSSWVNIGSNLVGRQVGFISFYLDNGTPYVAWTESTSPFKASVMTYNGSSWVYVGAPEFTAGNASWLSLAVDSGIIYLAFSDGSLGSKMTVMKAQ